MSSVSSFKPQDEAGRLLALRRYDLLDLEPMEEFDTITRLVKLIFGVNFAAVTLIDEDRQWIRSAAGMETGTCDRADSVCTHTIRQSVPLVIVDAARDPRTAENPFVTGSFGLRSYLGAPLTTPDGYNIGAVCVFCTTPREFSDGEAKILAGFSEIVMAQLELKLSARMDSLTEVPGRRSFIERLDRATVSLNAPGSASRAEQSTAMLLIDLDHFKSINDSFGHPAGDAVLRAAAAAMREVIRRDDSLARIGGEEFGIILPDVSLADAIAMGERLRASMTGLTIPEIGGRRVTASIGVAMQRAGEKRADWLERADKALYSAKQSGRDKVTALAA